MMSGEKVLSGTDKYAVVWCFNLLEVHFDITLYFGEAKIFNYNNFSFSVLELLILARIFGFSRFFFL